MSSVVPASKKIFNLLISRRTAKSVCGGRRSNLCYRTFGHLYGVKRSRGGLPCRWDEATSTAGKIKRNLVAKNATALGSKLGFDHGLRNWGKSRKFIRVLSTVASVWRLDHNQRAVFNIFRSKWEILLTLLPISLIFPGFPDQLFFTYFFMTFLISNIPAKRNKFFSIVLPFVHEFFFLQIFLIQIYISFWNKTYRRQSFSVKYLFFSVFKTYLCIFSPIIIIIIPFQNCHESLGISVHGFQQVSFV